MATFPKRPRTNVDGCCFGTVLADECHQKTAAELHLFTELSEEDQIIYRWRAGIDQQCDIVRICKYHRYKFSDAVFKKVSKCIDLFSLHKKKRKPDGTHNITCNGSRAQIYGIQTRWQVYCSWMDSV